MKKSLLTFMLFLCAMIAGAQETYNIECSIFTMAKFDADESQWDLRFKDADNTWKIYLSLKGEEGKLAGVYTINDASEDGCFIEDMTQDDVNYAFTEMNVTISAPDGVTDPKTEGCEVTGTAKDADGNTFNFHIKKDGPIIPTEVKTIDVDVQEVQWPTSDGGSYYEVTEKENPNNKWILTLTQKTGESTGVEFCGIDTTATYRINAETEKILHMDNGTITQTLDATNMQIKVDAALVMKDAIQYNFSFATPLKAEGEEELTFTDLQVDKSYCEYGTTVINASNDNITFVFQALDYSEIPSEYTDQTCDIAMSIFHKEKDEESGEETAVEKVVYSNAIIYARTEQEEGQATPVLHTKFLGDDNIIYTVDASFIKPEVTKKLTVKLDTCDFGGDDVEGHYFSCENDTLLVWVKMNSSEIEGHYTIDDLNNNSHIMKVVESSGMARTYYLSEADFTVTRKDTIYTLTGTCQAGPYLINLIMKHTRQGLKNDNYESDVDATFTPSDIIDKSILLDNELNAYLSVRLHSIVNKQELRLAIYPEEFDGYNIPAGEYEIASSSDYSYVRAGYPAGILNICYPSYYAKTNILGSVQTPVWFLTSGWMSATAADGSEEGTATSFEINALNSYGQNVHIAFSNTTDITNIKAGSNADDTTVGKVVKNGEIVIRKAGSEYNTTGQRKKLSAK